MFFVQGTISAENIQKREPWDTDFAQTNLPGHSFLNEKLFAKSHHLQCLGIWMNPNYGNKIHGHTN